MRKSGLNENGEFEDEYLYAILRDDWVNLYDPSDIKSLNDSMRECFLLRRFLRLVESVIGDEFVWHVSIFEPYYLSSKVVIYHPLTLLPY